MAEGTGSHTQQIWSQAKGLKKLTHALSLSLSLDIDTACALRLILASTGVTTKSSKAVLSKGKGSQVHYSLMSSTRLLSSPLTLQPSTPCPLLSCHLLPSPLPSELTYFGFLSLLFSPLILFSLLPHVTQATTVKVCWERSCKLESPKSNWGVGGASVSLSVTGAAECSRKL